MGVGWLGRGVGLVSDLRMKGRWKEVEGGRAGGGRETGCRERVDPPPNWISMEIVSAGYERNQRAMYPLVDSCRTASFKLIRTSDYFK